MQLPRKISNIQKIVVDGSFLYKDTLDVGDKMKDEETNIVTASKSQIFPPMDGLVRAHNNTSELVVFFHRWYKYLTHY